MDDAERTTRALSSPHETDDVLLDGGAPAGASTLVHVSSVRRMGGVDAHAAEQNRLLRALPLAEYERLLPHLTSRRLYLKQVLVEADAPIAEVHFVREGVASMVATDQEGGSIEVGTIGNDGLVGIPVLLGAESMSSTVIIQVEGHGWCMSADAFRRAVEERPVLRRLCLRYVQYFTDQIARSVACNRLHSLDERAARWLLMTHDRMPGDTFELTQEFLSVMLGVRRAGVTVAMGVLQSAGIIRYSRGRITVLDRPRLEEASCGCYHTTRTAYTRLMG